MGLIDLLRWVPTKLILLSIKGLLYIDDNGDFQSGLDSQDVVNGTLEVWQSEGVDEGVDQWGGDAEEQLQISEPMTEDAVALLQVDDEDHDGSRDEAHQEQD